jgi:signal transduction histidine kinase/ActR/RegA family two-component response regulator
MSATPPGGDRVGRLQRCIRDLAALNALPSLCVGRTPEEALGIVLDALPTALACDLVYLSLPGKRGAERGTLCGSPMTPFELAEVATVTATDADGSDGQLFLAGGKVFCMEAEIPVGSERGRLVAGRVTALDSDTDRVLIRTAANVVGTIFATANELEAARRKDDFLAMLGHELRNPLAPILIAVELLAQNVAVGREREIIDRNTRHLAHIVDDLLDISRVTRGELELRRETVTLSAVLERAAELSAPLMSRRGHQLRIDRDDDVTLEGDHIRLAQVFGNLLTNAAKFTPPGGEIEVTVRRATGRVLVTVSDNGCGISSEQLTRIFEPFVQAERDAHRGGLGLGLAIVSNLVERHGGTISVKSEGLGRGSAFTVELPTTARLEQPKETARTRASQARGGVRVLVVDDNVDIAELMAAALELEGFAVSVAHDGQGALEAWRSFRPHAGVLDVGLPDLNGNDLAKALRAEHGTTPVLIAATGYGQPTDRVRAADAGFDCHFVKPVSVHALVAVLDARIVETA